MGRYIVVYHAPLSARERLAQATPEQAMAGVQQWVAWAQKLGASLLDPGRPFGQTVELTPAGSAPAHSDMVGMSVIEAPDMAAALALVGDHHHLYWAEGCSITVHEEIGIPELAG